MTKLPIKSTTPLPLPNSTNPAPPPSLLSQSNTRQKQLLLVVGAHWPPHIWDPANILFHTKLSPLITEIRFQSGLVTHTPMWMLLIHFHWDHFNPSTIISPFLGVARTAVSCLLIRAREHVFHGKMASGEKLKVLHLKWSVFKKKSSWHFYGIFLHNRDFPSFVAFCFFSLRFPDFVLSLFSRLLSPPHFFLIFPFCSWVFPFPWFYPLFPFPPFFSFFPFFSWFVCYFLFSSFNFFLGFFSFPLFVSFSFHFLNFFFLFLPLGFSLFLCLPSRRFPCFLSCFLSSLHFLDLCFFLVFPFLLLFPPFSLFSYFFTSFSCFFFLFFLVPPIVHLS